MRIDIAWGQIQGNRPSQQDVAVCLSWRTGLHLLLLADGIGGHNGGQVASATVIESFRNAFIDTFDRAPRDRLLQALQGANYALFDRIEAEPELAGMGTTLIAATVAKSALHWVSVGDSPVWLVRSREIRRLNANHSIGGMLDKQVEDGTLSAAEAAAAPNRSHLLEAVLGQDINWVDAPSNQFDLEPGDCLVLASDGAETCGRDELCLIAGSDDMRSAEVVDAILAAVEGREKPAQDNATVIVVRLDGDKAKK